MTYDQRNGNRLPQRRGTCSFSDFGAQWERTERPQRRGEQGMRLNMHGIRVVDAVHLQEGLAVRLLLQATRIRVPTGTR